MSGGSVPSATLLLFLSVVPALRGESFEDCDFWVPDCGGWTWSKGWNLMTAQNITALELEPTAPDPDSHNNTAGMFLCGFWTDHGSKGPDQLEIVSPIFKPHTLENCSLQISLHMHQMDQARFQVVIKVPSNDTWKSVSFAGSSTNKWETKEEEIGILSQKFQVILKILNQNPVYPSHVAIGGIRTVGCYDQHPGVSVATGKLAGIIIGVIIFITMMVICVFYGWSRYHKKHRKPRVPYPNLEMQSRRLKSNERMISETNPNNEFGDNACTEQDPRKVYPEHLPRIKPLGKDAFGDYSAIPTDDTEQPIAEDEGNYTDDTEQPIAEDTTLTIYRRGPPKV